MRCRSFTCSLRIREANVIPIRVSFTHHHHQVNNNVTGGNGLTMASKAIQEDADEGQRGFIGSLIATVKVQFSTQSTQDSSNAPRAERPPHAHPPLHLPHRPQGLPHHPSPHRHRFRPPRLRHRRLHPLLLVLHPAHRLRAHHQPAIRQCLQELRCATPQNLPIPLRQCVAGTGSRGRAGIRYLD